MWSKCCVSTPRNWSCSSDTPGRSRCSCTWMESRSLERVLWCEISVFVANKRRISASPLYLSFIFVCLRVFLSCICVCCVFLLHACVCECSCIDSGICRMVWSWCTNGSYLCSCASVCLHGGSECASPMLLSPLSLCLFSYSRTYVMNTK